MKDLFNDFKLVSFLGAAENQQKFWKIHLQKRHSAVELLLSAFQGTEQNYAYSKAPLVPI